MNSGAAVGCSCGVALGPATVGFRVRPRLLGGSADGGVGSIVGGAVGVVIVGYFVVVGCVSEGAEVCGAEGVGCVVAVGPGVVGG